MKQLFWRGCKFFSGNELSSGKYFCSSHAGTWILNTYRSMPHSHEFLGSSLHKMYKLRNRMKEEWSGKCRQLYHFGLSSLTRCFGFFWILQADVFCYLLVGWSNNMTTWVSSSVCQQSFVSACLCGCVFVCVYVSVKCIATCTLANVFASVVGLNV